MKRLMRCISLLLVLCLCLSIVPIRVKAVAYANYTGIDFQNTNISAQRKAALTKAMQMVTVKWTCPADFPTWRSSGGSPNTVVATDGTSSTKFIKGKTYTGIPYSMADHTFDDIAWANALANGKITTSYMTGSYYGNGTTTAHGSDCSYFVYLALKAANAGTISYETTKTMLNSSLYTKISWSELKPADLFLKNGHVMMFIGMDGNKYAVFESDADDSKCSYNVYTKAQLSSYGCYRYNNFNDSNNLADVGTGFYAYIINTSRWKHLTNDGNNVSLRSETGAPNQVWYFERLSDGSYSIKSALNQWAMEVQDFGSHSGANVQTYPYNGNTAQQWYISGESGAYQFRAKCTNCVLDVAGGSSEDGTNIQMWELNNSDAQYFQIWVLDHYTLPKPSNPWITASSSAAKVVTGTVTLNFGAENATNYTIGIDRLGTGRVVTQELSGNSYTTSFNEPGIYQIYVTCYNSAGYVDTSRISITVYHDIGTNFAAPILHKGHWKIIENAYESGYRVQTATETGFANQLWYFERQADGSYKISSCYDGRCLDVRDASSQPDTIVQTHPSNDNPAQRWYIWEEAGGYVLKPQCSDCVLDLTDNNSANGTQIITYTFHGGAPQIWSIYRGEECTLQSPSLIVSAGSSISETKFAWNEVYGESRYDVKIWKGAAWDGDPYHVEWGATSGYSTTLPAGTYQAYVDASNYFDCKMSNLVSFTVNEHVHTYISAVTAPTCSAQGYTTHTCSACGYSYITDYTNAWGHDMGHWITENTATCTTDGSERRDCSRCDHYETRSISAAGHAYEPHVTAPTCTEIGYTQYICAVCGSSYTSDYTDATGHDHKATVTFATCTKQGYTTYTCHCGDSYVSDYTNVLGHDMGDWGTVTEASCTEDGQQIQECSRCDHSKSRTTEALGHAWDDGVVTIEPTEEIEGEMTYTCGRCRLTRTESIPARDHEHHYDAILTAPTCTEKGYTTHTCSGCSHSYIDTYVDALGHDMGQWFTVADASCSEEGLEKCNCSLCDYSEIREIAATGHSFTNYGSDNNASCTQDGTKTAVCDYCDAADTMRNVGSALGHDFSDWTVLEEPTTTAECLESRYCYRCGLEESRVIASMENPFTDVPTGSFYYEPVLWAVANGITNGTSATTFGPNDQCMRAHVVTFLHRTAGSPVTTAENNPFADVKTSDFFYKPVLWAVEKGITNGTTTTTFGSYANCNRAAVVTFLWRAAGSPEPSATINPFVDVKTTDFFYKPVLWAVENGITNGIDATHFGPTTYCNRAQVVTFLYRTAKINNDEIVKVASGIDFYAILKSNGKVDVVSWNDIVRSDWCADWTDIVDIDANNYFILGIQKNGSVVFQGVNVASRGDVGDWSDIKQVSAGAFFSVGLKTNGTVVAIGSNDDGECNVSDWTGIIAISAGSSHTVGLKADGTVVATGSNNMGQCDVAQWRDIIAIAAGDGITIGLKVDGTVVTTCVNWYYNSPAWSDIREAEEWTDVIAIDAGREHIVALKSDGTVATAGFVSEETNSWSDVVAISAGGYHTIGLKEDGTILIVQQPEVT